MGELGGCWALMSIAYLNLYHALLTLASVDDLESERESLVDDLSSARGR